MSNMDWTDLLMGSGLRVGYNASDLKKTCKCRCVFFPNFYHHSAIRKKLEKTLILAFEAKSIRFSSSIIFFVKSYFRNFFLNTYKWHFFQILEHCVGGAHLHSGPPAAAGNNFFICWAQMGFPDTWPNWFGSHAVCFTWKKMDLTIIPDILEPC